MLGHLHRLRGQLAERPKRNLPEELHRAVRGRHDAHHKQIRSVGAEDARGANEMKVISTVVRKKLLIEWSECLLECYFVLQKNKCLNTIYFNHGIFD